ncbi:hypothetical protein BN439_0141 [Erwinia amylovora Ea644]|nr:hypothetical protein BN439_0141 [Erwinia amylovora Ea644]
MGAGLKMLILPGHQTGHEVRITPCLSPACAMIRTLTQ